MLVPFPHLQEAVRGIPILGRHNRGAGYSSVEQVLHKGRYLSIQWAILALPPPLEGDGSRAVDVLYQD